MGRKTISERDTYVLPSYYGSAHSNSSSDYSTTPTSPTSFTSTATQSVDEKILVHSPPAPSTTRHGYEDATDFTGKEGRAAASGLKRDPPGDKPQDHPRTSLQRSNAIHHGESQRENIALADSVSPLDRFVRQADRMHLIANDGPFSPHEHSYEEPARHPEASLPPRGPQRYYPPSSFFMDETDIIEKPKYAPGPALSQPERQRFRRLSDVERFRKAELDALHVVSADSTAVIPELAHLRTTEQPSRGRRNSIVIPRKPVGNQEYPPAAAPKKKHRRNSSLQRIKHVAAQASHGLKEGAQKFGHELKEGTQKVRHSIQVQVRRLSIDKYKGAPVAQTPTFLRPSHPGGRYQQPSSHFGPAEGRVQFQQTAHSTQPRHQRRRASSPPAAAIAVALPPPEQVYSRPTYFTKCQHVSPPSSLPLDVHPCLVPLTPTTLRHPTIAHKQHFRAQSIHVDLKPLKISVIPGRCAECDWAVHRDHETSILDAHKSQFPPGFQTTITYLQTQLYHAELEGNELLAQRLADEIADLKLQLRNAIQARDKKVKALWRDFTPRSGVTCAGINGPELQRAKETRDEERQDRKNKQQHGNECRCTHDSDGNTIRTTQGAPCERDAESSHALRPSTARGTGTGFGFMRDTKHGGPIDDVVEEGRMRLSWTRHIRNSNHHHQRQPHQQPHQHQQQQQQLLAGGYTELKDGEGFNGLAFKNVDIDSSDED